MIRGPRRRRGTDPVFATFCALAISVGLPPLAWLEMSVADFIRLRAARRAS